MNKTKCENDLKITDPEVIINNGVIKLNPSYPAFSYIDYVEVDKNITTASKLNLCGFCRKKPMFKIKKIEHNGLVHLDFKIMCSNKEHTWNCVTVRHTFTDDFFKYLKINMFNLAFFREEKYRVKKEWNLKKPWWRLS